MTKTVGAIHESPTKTDIVVSVINYGQQITCQEALADVPL